MEGDTDDQTPNEDMAQSFESNVKIIGVTCDPIPDIVGEGRKRTRASH